MRLYTRTGAIRVDDPVYGAFFADERGAFDFPNDLADRLHATHFRGEKAWETDAERETRLTAEQLEKLRDPATLLAAIQGMAANQASIATLLAAQQTTASAPERPTTQPVDGAAVTKETAADAGDGEHNDEEREAGEDEDDDAAPAEDTAEKPAPKTSRGKTSRAAAK